MNCTVQRCKNLSCFYKRTVETNYELGFFLFICWCLRVFVVCQINFVPLAEKDGIFIIISAIYGQQQYQAQPAPIITQSTMYLTQGPADTPINDYLGYSIFTLLCCCLPLGIMALVYSATVSSNYFVCWLALLQFNLNTICVKSLLFKKKNQKKFSKLVSNF